MDQFNVYKDMKARTNGEIYIGVVGPVRTGKSTFIKRFMNLMVLPNIEDENDRNRANDELPQSSSGKTIMTTEPKFVPNEAVSIKTEEGIELNVRLIDCVGYMVEGATGHMEGEEERLVKTPWFDYEIPFTKAAAIGTKKVITEHSTIGVVVTCDGSFGEIAAKQYEPAEEETIKQLKALKKPFVVLLNTIHPYSESTKQLAAEKEEKYQTKVLPMNLEQMKKEDIYEIIKSVLMEFPISSIGFYVPRWTEMLKKDHPLKMELLQMARDVITEKTTMRDIYEEQEKEYEYITGQKLESVAMDSGEVVITVKVGDVYYYEFLSETTGMEIRNEYEFIKIMGELAKKKKEYEEVGEALAAVKQRGYGVVTPTKEEIVLEEPQIVKHGSKYGVKIKASAPSIHMIRANISTEIAPIVGEEYQAKELAGKEAVFQCDVKKIETKEVPELDDEFAKDVSEFDTLAEYKEDVKKKLTEKKEKEARTAKENAAVDKAIENAQMDIPELMTKTECRQMMDDFSRRMQQQGLSMEQYFQFTGQSMDKMMEDMKPQALKRIQTRLVLEAVVKAENIQADDAAVEEQFDKMAEDFKMDKEQIKGMFGEEQMAQLKEDLAVQKAIDFLVAEAKFVD